MKTVDASESLQSARESKHEYSKTLDTSSFTVVPFHDLCCCDMSIFSEIPVYVFINDLSAVILFDKP